MILRLHEGNGWPGLLGSLDVMHLEWKNGPKAHRGAYQGKEGVATIGGLECLGQTMILILWIVHHFSMICQLEGLQKYSLPSTTNNTIWGIIWLTESTQIGIYFSRQFQSHKVQGPRSKTELFLDASGGTAQGC